MKYIASAAGFYWAGGGFDLSLKDLALMPDPYAIERTRPCDKG
jgi:hypothetical protein